MKSITLKLLVLAMLLVIPACSKSSKSIKPPDVDYYTCTMHTSVHADAPGKCPICGMDLVPVFKKGGSEATAETLPQRQGVKDGGDKQSGQMQGMEGMPGMGPGGEMRGAETHEFVVPVERQQQIGVTYATVQTKPLSHRIRAVGRVVPETQRVWSFVARVEGYVQQLFVAS